MSASTSFSPPDVNQTMLGLGFKPVNLFSLLNHITSSFGTLIQTIFAWVYFLSEVAILVGALVYMVGAIGHHSKIKRSGALIVLYAILGFIAAVLLPGVIVAVDSNLHS